MEGTSEHITASPPSEDSASGASAIEQVVGSVESVKAGNSKRSSGSAGKSNSSGKPSSGSQAPAEINLHSLLKAGVHFGHQSSRWHPSMSPYIYTTRNGIHIINLPKTIQCWQSTREAVVEIVSRGGSVLFVGTKKQAQRAIAEEAERCGAFYVAHRWLGGMITNFRTIRNSIERMKKLEALLGDDEQRAKYKKKELLMMDREREKLHFSLSGIRDMHAPPQLMFVIDTKREDIAVSEAKRLDIPVVALVDTNSNPADVDFPIPSNDDATRAIRLFSQAVADAVIEGKAIFAERQRSIKELEAAKAKSREPQDVGMDGKPISASEAETSGDESSDGAETPSQETPPQEASPQETPSQEEPVASAEESAEAVAEEKA